MLLGGFAGWGEGLQEVWFCPCKQQLRLGVHSVKGCGACHCMLYLCFCRFRSLFQSFEHQVCGSVPDPAQGAEHGVQHLLGLPQRILILILYLGFLIFYLLLEVLILRFYFVPY